MGALVLDFVRTHKHDFLGVFVLTNVGRNILAIEKLETAYQSLSSAQKQTREGKKLAAYVDGVKSSKVGAVVKNFVLNDPNGQPLSFDQYRGKYVWIDFWASWCAPCKKAFPHMKEIYAAYKSRGFEILGISTDAKIEPWLKILPELKNPWPQVWDDKNVMSQFAVTAFPTSFLIDPNGVILLKEIGYDPNGESLLEKKLEAIFGSKVASMANL
jgi:thiol-disulfide isomerase/thioredoxin